MCDILPMGGLPQLAPEIADIALSAKAMTGELITAIDKLRSQDSRKRHWRSIHQALATKWNIDNIRNIQGRLHELRDQLRTNMREHIVSEQQTALRRLETLQQKFQQLHCPRVDLVQDLISRVKGLNGDTLAKSYLYACEKVFADVGLKRTHMEVELKVLNGLRYPIDHYHNNDNNNNDEAYPRTFERIFDDPALPPSDPHPHIKLRQWLNAGNGLYWLYGKTGSGKTTLMRYLGNCSGTRSCLQSWAGQTKLSTASYYFGNTFPQLEAFLRHILFHLIREPPYLVPQLFPFGWTELINITQTSWSIDELKKALARLGRCHVNAYFCFFIDGLDRFDGKPIELLRIIRKLSNIPHIKICVSSRYSRPFIQFLGKIPHQQLCVQWNHREDIQQLAQDELERRLEIKQHADALRMYSDLVEGIVRKSVGVFVWVSLAVHLLCDGLSNEDNADLLLQRLEDLPYDLHELFHQFSGSVDRLYRDKMAMLCHIALCARTHQRGDLLASRRGFGRTPARISLKCHV
ncbi:hypothetical protein BDV95DRAFT_24199 [Massariosphaeria phaeospora]|uniref:Nephrocystin 3-like N-terminal domain-containing protein n=1 Tax=Massariosphaeria phaeospora TaxID=100035 RepID=A0A7C8IRW0_9PLEO|nr:hypothetical protein BDV95DRAFT_24199 [Massariosphaeria phaeospora]